MKTSVRSFLQCSHFVVPIHLAAPRGATPLAPTLHASNPASNSSLSSSFPVKPAWSCEIRRPPRACQACPRRARGHPGTRTVRRTQPSITSTPFIRIDLAICRSGERPSQSLTRSRSTSPSIERLTLVTESSWLWWLWLWPCSSHTPPPASSWGVPVVVSGVGRRWLRSLHSEVSTSALSVARVVVIVRVKVRVRLGLLLHVLPRSD